MPVFILALLLSPVAPILIYRYIRSKDPCADQIRPRVYVIGAVTGATLCTLLIMIPELIWDRLFQPGGCVTLGDHLVSSFLRAALIEEAVKMLFVIRTIRKRQIRSRIGCILLSGTIGIGYGLIEKLATGSPAAMLFNTVLPFHMLFQFLMGDLLWQAQTAPDPGSRRKTRIAAYLIPFLIHGAWDGALSVMEYLTGCEDAAWKTTLGTIGVLLLIAGGAVAGILAIRKVGRIAGENSMTIPAGEREEM